MQIHSQSLNARQRKHKSGGGQFRPMKTDAGGEPPFDSEGFGCSEIYIGAQQTEEGSNETKRVPLPKEHRLAVAARSGPKRLVPIGAGQPRKGLYMAPPISSNKTRFSRMDPPPELSTEDAWFSALPPPAHSPLDPKDGLRKGNLTQMLCKITTNHVSGLKRMLMWKACEEKRREN